MNRRKDIIAFEEGAEDKYLVRSDEQSNEWLNSFNGEELVASARKFTTLKQMVNSKVNKLNK